MAERLPLSVWPTAQHTSRAQRTGRYLPDSVAHPAKMLPAIARHAITAYTAPGDLVVDPMCGIGTTLVEAVHLGRDAIGMEYEPRWADLARRNLDHAASQGASGQPRVFTGDSRGLPNLLGRELRGQVALVLTSPPYGPSVHGQATARPGQGVAKRDYRYSRDRANLAHVPHDELLDAFAAILTACAGYLRPGGIAAVTARPWRRDGVLVDLPAAVTAAAQQAGLIAFERIVALLAGFRTTGSSPAPRSSNSPRSAKPASAACRCESSHTKTCLCSAGPYEPPSWERQATVGPRRPVAAASVPAPPPDHAVASPSDPAQPARGA